MSASAMMAVLAAAPWNRWRRWVAGHIEKASQVDQQLGVIGQSSAISLVAGLSLVLITGLSAPPPTSLVVLGWLGALSVTALLWLLLGTAFRKSEAGIAALANWAALHTLMVMLMGFIWGLCIWVFKVPQDFSGSIAVITTQTAVAMTGWLFFSGFFPALLMYSLGMFVPATIAYAVHGDFAHAALCLALHVVYVLQGRKVIEIIRIRHEKEGLVLQLQQENSAKQLALAAAHEATAAKTRFFAAVSHDVRQPLYSLSLLADTTVNLISLDQRRDLQQRMQQSVSMLDSLFTHLLEVSQLDAGALQPRLEALDVPALMRETAQIFEAELEARHCTLRVTTQDVFVLADRAWLQRIVSNLLGNALSHAPGSELKFFADLRGECVALGVQDHGPGIAEGDREKIFEEFFRAPDRAADVKGFGLGLSIVRRLARAMHTDVQLRSSPGGGCTFWLDLTVVHSPVRLHETPPDVLAASGSPTGSLLQGARIGVVEDDENIGHALSALLTSWGAQALWSRSAEEALAASEPVDALIVDFQLATEGGQTHRTGVEVATALRTRWSAITPVPVPVLIVSSLNLLPEQRAGFDALVKPLAPANLRAWLLNAMAARVVGTEVRQRN